MHVLIVTFELDGLDDRSYRAQAEAAATYGGAARQGLARRRGGGDLRRVYLFASRDAIDRYLASETVAAMRPNPYFANLSARVFDTFGAATWLTQGRLRLYPDRSAA